MPLPTLTEFDSADQDGKLRLIFQSLQESSAEIRSMQNWRHGTADEPGAEHKLNDVWQWVKPRQNAERVALSALIWSLVGGTIVAVLWIIRKMGGQS
jgi:hypothetical protein